MAWFIASIIPVSLIVVGLVNPSDPSLTDYYGFFGIPLAVLLTVAFIGKTIRARDIPTSEKCVWTAVLVLFFPFSIALPVFAYERIVKPGKTAKACAGGSQLEESKTE